MRNGEPSHRGIASLVTGRATKAGNHTCGSSGAITNYCYFGNLIVVENSARREYWINPRWIKYSVSTSRAHSAYIQWFESCGYTRVEEQPSYK